MVEPIFQAPPPPPMNQNDSFQTEHHEEQLQEKILQNESPSVQQTSEKDTQNTAQKEQVLKRLNELKENFVRYFWYSVGGLFLLGMFFGCAMSGGDSAPKAVAPQGLTKIIRNSYTKSRLPVCGSVRLSEPCLFYVLNYDIIDHLSEDYFSYVASSMKRQENSIKSENVLYAKELIRPGYFAEIIVPAKK